MANLLLLSGGIDSAVCLKRYDPKLCVGFDYGQPHRVELDYAAQLADDFGVPFERHIIPALPKVDDVAFAGRNAVLLAHGAAIAQARALDTVIIGCNHTDANRFPDCRPDFIRHISKAMRAAYGVTIWAPLLMTTKAALVREAAGMTTWSCYAGGTEPCGECLACRMRHET